ncbi:MAG: phosphatase PAP2 family protein [Candidatus Gastranaerophilaceae bacterium]
MKKIFITITLFVIYSVVINFCPLITQCDRSFIVIIQKILSIFPVSIALLPDCILYSTLIVLPLLFCTYWGLRKKYYADTVIILSVPLITFILNCIIKPLIKRPRPPYELQLSVHPDSFSYVSSHSLVTICLWGMIVFYFYKYCPYKKINIAVAVFSTAWTLFVGLSRIWLGVHNPTDVIGAYFLGLILIYLYILLRNKIENIFNK